MPAVKGEVAQKVSLALRYMTDGVVERAESKTPKRKNRLRKDILKQVLGLHAQIRWQKKYAAPQEAGVANGRPIRNYTTPGTGPHFAENAVKDVVKNAGEYFRKAGIG